jgi:hypothetical protein
MRLNTSASDMGPHVHEFVPGHGQAIPDELHATDERVPENQRARTRSHSIKNQAQKHDKSVDVLYVLFD